MKSIFAFSLLLTVLLFTAGCTKEEPAKPAVVCPTGYTGNDCTTQITPTQIIVESITFTSVDRVVPGTSDAPDFVFSITSNGTDVFRSDRQWDAPVGTVININYAITNPFSAYTFELIDFGFGISSYYVFYNETTALYSSQNRFPTEIPIRRGNTAFTMRLRYVW